MDENGHSISVRLGGLQVSALPKHIYAHPKGYRIQIRRGAALFEGFIACAGSQRSEVRGQKLAEAVTLRDKLLLAAGPVLVRRSKARSNTGVPGISEAVWWKHNRRWDCFTVFLGRKQSPQMKRVLYGAHRTRAAAWATAIKLRRSVGGIIPTAVTEVGSQMPEVGPLTSDLGHPGKGAAHV